MVFFCLVSEIQVGIDLLRRTRQRPYRRYRCEPWVSFPVAMISTRESRCWTYCKMPLLEKLVAGVTSQAHEGQLD